MPRKTATSPLPYPGPRTVPKAPVKLCEFGHRLIGKGKCPTCKLRAEREERNRLAAQMDAALRGPAPRFLEVRVVSTGRVRRYEIPPHLAKWRKAARKRR